MAENQILDLTPRHENIIAFLIAHPRLKKGEVARQFGVTPAWLSTVIHSDVFQAKLAERQDEYFGSVTKPIREKLENLASLAIDDLEEKLPSIREPAEIREIAKLALSNLGFGQQAPSHPGAPTLVQNNTYLTVDKEVLQGARERIINRTGRTDGRQQLSAPEKLQAGNGDPVGAALSNPTPVAKAYQAQGPAAEGGNL